MTKILLDTNAYSAFMAGDQTIFDYIVDSDVVYVSSVMLGELFAGFARGDKFSANKQELKSFLSKNGIKVINVTMETSEIFGEIKASLHHSGKMIPLNDIWIATHAVETGSKLVTYDSHFKQIAGLRLWDEMKH